MAKIDDTIAARHARYGTFLDNAGSAQLIKFAFRSGFNWNSLENDQKEALEQIASKIGRILTGDYNHIDSWHDITGYAKLVENRLLGKRDTDVIGSNFSGEPHAAASQFGRDGAGSTTYAERLFAASIAACASDAGTDSDEFGGY